jgi:hypothetical protein
VTSDLHKKEMKDTLMGYIAKVKKTVEEESAESEFHTILSFGSKPRSER